MSRMILAFVPILLLPLTFTLSTARTAAAQQDHSVGSAADIRITGVVRDAATSQPIARARLAITRDVDGTVRTTSLVTNSLGQFSLNTGGSVNVEHPVDSGHDTYWIEAPYPNPFARSSGLLTIRYETPNGQPSQASVQMFDILGRRVETAGHLAAGVYFYRLRFEDGVSNSRTLVVAGSGPLDVLVRHLGTGMSHGSGSGNGLSKTGAIDVNFVIEKDAYVSVDDNLSLDETIINQVTFDLNLAPPPTAAFSFSENQAGLPSTFDASASVGASGESLKYSWDFGDGRFGGGDRIAHVFTSAGNRTVSLTVSGNYGATASLSQVVAVAAPPPPVRSDGVIVGTVRQPNTNPVQGVLVEVIDGGASETTDAFGKVTLTDLDVGVPVRLKLSKTGFTTQYVRVDMPLAPANPENFEATMRTRQTLTPIDDVENGAIRNGINGLQVVLPVDGLTHSDGSLVTGSVDVSMTPINVDVPEQRSTFPGVFQGYDEVGTDGLLLSFGVGEFAFEQEGEELQLAPGKTATVHIPIYTGGATLGQTIPLWSVDSATGLWIQEGVGTVVASPASPTGLALRAEVSHFSWWNCDDFDADPIPRAVRCIVLDQDQNEELVACWVGGASTGPSKTTVAEAPVYEVRTLVAADGANLLFPRGRETLVAGVATLENGEVWRGTGTVDGQNSSDPLIIELQRAQGGGDAIEIALPADLEGSFDVPSEVDTYSFTGAAGQELFVFAGYGVGSYAGAVSLKDPEGNTLTGFEFDSNTRSDYRTVVLPVDGIYVVTVSETAFGSGTYGLSIKPTVEVTLPFASSNEVFAVSGALNVYAFEGAEGDVFAVGAGPNPDGGGILDICLSGGSCVVDNLNFRFREESKVLRLPSTGRYLVLVRGAVAGGEGKYTLSLQVPGQELSVGTNHSITLDRSELALFVLDVEVGDTLAVFGSSDNPSGLSLEPWGLDNEGDLRFVSENVVDMYHLKYSPNQIGREFTGPFYLLAKTSTSAPAQQEWAFGLSHPRYASLTFGGDGQATLDGALDVHGQHLLVSFPASAGDGVEVVLGATQDPIDTPTALTLRFGRADNLDAFDYGGVELYVEGNYSSLAQKIEESATYLANIVHIAGALGDIRLTANKTAASGAILIEGDTPCGGSTTTSLAAGIAAATDGGIVTLCTGTHRMATPAVVAAQDVTIEGQDAATTIVVADGVGDSFGSTRAFSLYGNATIRNLTTRTDRDVSTFFGSRATFADPYPTLTMENVGQSPVDGQTVSGPLVGGDLTELTGTNLSHVTDNGTAVFVEVSDQVILSDLEFDGQLRVDDASDDVLIVEVTNSVLSVSADFRNAASVTIRDCDIGMDSSFPLMLSGISSSTIENNNIAVTPGNARSLRLSGGGSAEIRSNSFFGRVSIEAGGGSIEFEKNNIVLSEVTCSTCATFDITHRTNLDASTMVVQNNVLENVWAGSSFSINGIINIEDVDLFASVGIFNNSVRTGVQSAAGKAAIGASLNNTGFTGVLPVTIVNNVLAGTGGTGISFPVGTTIDSDYNLFFNYTTPYDGGTTTTGTHDLDEPSGPGDPPPLFANDLLELADGSAAIDAGAGTPQYPGVPLDDYDGTARPVGAAHDMGAHERGN